MSCRFALAEVREGEILDEEGYNIFEPTVRLEIGGRNVFTDIGIDGVSNVVIMHFMESAMKTTQQLIDGLRARAEGDYEYWLLGTGFGIKLTLKDRQADVTLKVDYRYGPIQDRVLGPQVKFVGTVDAKEWVRAIVLLSKELGALFERLNPEIYKSLRDQEKQRQALESWLTST